MKDDESPELLETRRWEWLENELKSGLEADESEFIEFDVAEFLKKAKRRRDGN